MLLISFAVILLSFALAVRPDQRVTLRGLPEYPLPATCMSRSVFGVTCPGCGLTRSFIHLAQGNWSASVATHRLGWLLAMAVVLQLPYRLYALRRGELSARTRFAGACFSYLLLAALLVNWLWGVGWSNLP